MQKPCLQRILRNRLALSTVVTTLIILVISVLLASVVTYFAINVTSTRVQEESLVLGKQHVWFDASSDKAQAVIMVVNEGGRDVVVEKLTVRGQACAWSNVFYTVTSDSITSDLVYNATLVDGGSISIGGVNHVFKQTTSDMTLQSGKTLIIYISNPDSISVNDVGLTVSITVYTVQSIYHKETNVQGANNAQTVAAQPEAPTPTPTAAPQVEDVTLSDMQVWYDSSLSKAQVALVIQNTGGINVIISEISCKNAWGNVYVYTGTFTLPSALLYLPDLATGSATPLGAGKTLTAMAHWPQDLTIQPGQSMILYVKNAVRIASSDVGSSKSVDITMLSSNVYSLSATVKSAS